MGYTHYWNTKNCRDKASKDGLYKALPIVADIVKRYRNILQYETDDSNPPVVDQDVIRFNGIDEDGHETFLFNILSSESDFCKTARKPYDLPVCEILLVLKAYIPNLKIDSDGFSEYMDRQKDSISFDGKWNEAIENVRQLYGIKYHGEIVKDRTPYCDLAPIFDGFEASDFKHIVEVIAVKSDSLPGKEYLVTCYSNGSKVCSCKHFEMIGSCSHIKRN